MCPGRLARTDYEYVRRGTANIFCVVEPLTGDRLTYASQNRKAAAYARTLARIERKYPTAKTIHLVQDNLSTHTERSLITTFGAKRATGCGDDSPSTTRPSTPAGSTSRNWKQALSRDSA
jgi:hypothetical protein